MVKGNRYTEVSSPSISFNTFPVSIRGSEIDFFFVPISSQFLLYFFSLLLSISSHSYSVFLLTPAQMWAPVVVLPPVHDPAHVPRGSVGLHGGDRPHQVAWQTPTIFIVIYLHDLHAFASLPLASFKLNMISGCRDEQEVVISMGGRVEEVKVVFMVEQLNHFDSTTNLFPLQKTYNANLFQSLAVTNGHHDSKEDMDMKDDNNQEVTHP